MKLTNLEIVQAGDGLQQIGSIKLPVETSMEFARLTVQLIKTIKPIEKERKAIVKKYEQKPKGDPGKDKPSPEEIMVRMEEERPSRETMRDEIDALMEQETEVPFEKKIKLPKKITVVCEKCHHNQDGSFQIEPNILTLLEPFIDV